MDSFEEITLEQIVKMILKNKFLIIIFALAGCLISYSVTFFLIEKKYESTIKLYVYTPNDQKNALQDINALNYAQRVVNTYIEMLDTRAFYSEIIDKTKLSYTEEQMKKAVQFKPLNNTEVFQVTVTTKSPEDSELIARTISEIAPKNIEEIQENAYLKIVDPAVLPEKEASPSMKINLAVGFLLGIFIAFVFAFLRDILDITVKDEEDLLQKYSLPVLAVIPDFDEVLAKNNKSKRKGEAV